MACIYHDVCAIGTINFLSAMHGAYISYTGIAIGLSLN